MMTDDVAAPRPDGDLAALRAEAETALAGAADLRALDAVRVAVLGKSGSLSGLLKGLGAVPPESRKDRGAALNHLKNEVEALLDARKTALEAAALTARLKAERLDVSLPPRPFAPGTAADGGIHPINRTIEELTAIFGAMGFRVVEGPDIESDWHNFGALNIPDHHPARQDHDTFYMPGTDAAGQRRVLRTQTSPLQIRTMLGEAPPIRIIAPGRTYRADHDATHSPMFHQVEGLVIDRGITLGHLKGCLTDFLRAYFGISDLPVRFRSSYFPFTEPSMEVDIGWNRKTGELGAKGAGELGAKGAGELGAKGAGELGAKGAGELGAKGAGELGAKGAGELGAKGEGGGDWLEILGSGMVHPKVLANCGLDPREWQGFAFGMGIERITMLKHGMPDLRPFYESDLRWLRHWASDPLAPASLHEGI